MQFKTNNLSQLQMYTKKFENFRGLDYTNAKLDIADNRSPDAQNFIFKDGINQKRNGYSQVLKIDSGANFNGFWEFIDSNKKVHRIAHVGNKIYEVTYNENPYLNSYKELSVTYRPNIITSANWTSYITNGIKDRRSYGVVRGDRLYIFCGIMLVYGSWDKGTTWELRAVRENEDTYIPITTTNITHSMYEGESTRASLEEVNMMTYFRKNKIYGAKSESIELKSYSPGDWGQEFAETNNIGWQFEGQVKENTKSIYFTLTGIYDEREVTENIIIPLEMDGKRHTINWDSLKDENGFDMNILFKEACPALSIFYTYTDGYLNLKAQFGLVATLTGVTIYGGKLTQSFSYQLDATDIYTAYNPVLKINSDYENITYDTWVELETNKYVPIYDDIIIYDIEIDAKNGILTISRNCENSLDPNPNIEITFTTLSAINNKSYEKIDNCTIGIVFGYNGIEHLFVSGNEDYPNMDWHTTESLLANDNTTVPNSQNLTYFGDLSYAFLGNNQTKVKSYTLLNDNTLGILKEFSNTEPNLYVREPYITDAIDPSGNVVYDFSGNAYQKVYYKQYMAAIGEGCVSSYATSNLSGDKLFLSENGVYGIELDYNNYVSNQRYAKEKSRLINPVLEKYGPNILKNAIAISYQNRYYLSIDDEEGTVYIADARFRNSDASEMNDTMGYEWWCWKNVSAHIWFVDLNGDLGFGTKDGRLCLFNDANVYRDRKITTIQSGGISYDKELKKFVVSSNYDIKEGSKIKFITDLEELVFQYSDVITIEGNVIVCTSEDIFYNYIIYLENKEVILKRESDIKCIITDLDYDIGGFKLKYTDNEQEIVLAETDVITKKLDTEYVTQYDSENNEFTLLSLNGKENINLYGDIYNIDEDLKAFILEDKPVVAYWYTPYINFENSDFAKTLKYVTIIPEKVQHGSAKIELFTKTKSKNIDAFNVQGIDSNGLLDNLDFSSFSIEIKDFAQSFSKKVKIKNFNFIVALMKSEDDKNFAVQNLTLTYVMGRRNKGVK